MQYENKNESFTKKIKYFFRKRVKKVYKDKINAGFLRAYKQKVNRSFLLACQNGHLDVAQYLLTSEELKYRADIGLCDEALFLACGRGRLNVVQYLLTGKDLKKNANIHTRGNGAVLEACKYGHFDIVKYLLTGILPEDGGSRPKQEYWVDATEKPRELATVYGALESASRHGWLDIVKFFMEDENIKDKVDLHEDNDAALLGAIDCNREDAALYLAQFYTIEKMKIFLEKFKAKFLQENLLVQKLMQETDILEQKSVLEEGINVHGKEPLGKTLSM